MPTPSSIVITLDGIDITDDVIYKETTFTSQANPMQGSFKVTVKDIDHSFDDPFTAMAGKKLACVIDGVPLFGGYVFNVGRGHFFPAQDSSTPSAVPRKWILTGPDFNVLFDKRVIYDPANPTVSPEVPSGKQTITKAFRYLVSNYIDYPSDLDMNTYVDTIVDENGDEEVYGSENKGSLYVGAGKTWREQMDDFADHSGIIYYIDGGFALHLHAYESTLTPWIITDMAIPGYVRFRSGEYDEDFVRVYTEALVWGGSAIQGPEGPAGDVVFKKYPTPPASGAREQGALDRLALYGRWQMGEEHAGQMNYLTQESVNKRAKVIINGPTGVPPTNGIEGGFSRPLQRFTCTWFAHDVPGQNHIRPGHMQDIILYTQGGSGGGPLVRRLPLRSMEISFPTLPTNNPGGQTYVQFQGEFGVAYSDSRHLWTWLKKNRARSRESQSIVMVDNSSTSLPAGSQGTFYPAQNPNGTRTTFTFENAAGNQVGFMTNMFDVFLNGLYQRKAIDWTYDSDTQELTFITAPDTGDNIWVTGYVTG